MSIYSCSTSSLITALARNEHETHNFYKQVWLADDVSYAGDIDGIHCWWGKLRSLGPGYGYYPEPSKTVLIVNPEKLSYAIQMFGNSGVTITCEGKRHLGAVVGTTGYKEKYDVI